MSDLLPRPSSSGEGWGEGDPRGQPAPHPNPLPRVGGEGVGLYIHIPFCAHKCPYCDFASVPLPHPSSERYVDAVLAEALREATGWAFATVFVGGGTPTALPADELDRLLTGLRSVCEIMPSAEVTVEANPGTLDASAAEALVDCGVTRLSIGVQSFSDDTLRTLGRAHSSGEALAAIEIARSFPSFSVDLMFAVPGQSVGGAVADASRAVDLGAPHVSAYALTYEAGTPFERSLRAGAVSRLSEDVELRMFESVGATLEAAGLTRYEVSNFARPGHECAHNLGYWNCGEYVGLGAAAHSFIAGERRWNVRDPSEYVGSVVAGRSPVAGREPVTAKVRYLEHLMLGLRMTRGVEWDVLTQLAGAAGERELLTRVRRQEDLGSVELAEGYLRLTARGLPLSDSVIAALA